MSDGPSIALTRFIDSISRPITGPAQLKSFDLGALAGIAVDERDAAVDAVLEHLEGGRDDPRAVEALSSLATERANAALDDLVAGPPSITRVTAAQAIFNRDPAASTAALRDCANASDDRVRATAVETFGRVDAAAADVFAVALTDEAAEVCNGALRGALLKYRLDTYDNIIGSRIYHLSLGVTSPIEAMREDATRELSDIIRQLESGATAQALEPRVPDRGVSEAIGTLWERVDDPDAEIDVGIVSELTPGEADYAVEYLSRALARGDARVVPLLQAIGTRRAEIALAAV